MAQPKHGFDRRRIGKGLQVKIEEFLAGWISRRIRRAPAVSRKETRCGAVGVMAPGREQAYVTPFSDAIGSGSALLQYQGLQPAFEGVSRRSQSDWSRPYDRHRFLHHISFHRSGTIESDEKN
jgi:hypothetical protein